MCLLKIENLGSLPRNHVLWTIVAHYYQPKTKLDIKKLCIFLGIWIKKIFYSHINPHIFGYLALNDLYYRNTFQIHQTTLFLYLVVSGWNSKTRWFCGWWLCFPFSSHYIRPFDPWWISLCGFFFFFLRNLVSLFL